jgi:hypothetical protein
MRTHLRRLLTVSWFTSAPPLMRAKTASKCPDAEASDNGVQPPPVDCLVAEKQIQKKQPKRHKGIFFEPKISMMRLGQVWSGETHERRRSAG